MPPAQPRLIWPTGSPVTPPPQCAREGCTGTPSPWVLPAHPVPCLQPWGAQLCTPLSAWGAGGCSWETPCLQGAGIVPSQTPWSPWAACLGILPGEVGALCPSGGLEGVGTGTAITKAIAHHLRDPFRHLSGTQRGTAPTSAPQLLLQNKGPQTPMNSTSNPPWKP